MGLFDWMKKDDEPKEEEKPYNERPFVDAANKMREISDKMRREQDGR